VASSVTAHWLFPLDPNSPFNMRSPATFPDLTDNLVGCEAVIHGNGSGSFSSSTSHLASAILSFINPRNSPIWPRFLPNLAELQLKLLSRDGAVARARTVSRHAAA
jgi:hypothetical protein